MRVRVTLANIQAYGLDTLTGNTVDDLMARAAEELLKGNELFVRIPDVMGGDTEAPTERNVFEHYSEIPDPDDSHVHEQISVNLLAKMCSYKLAMGLTHPGQFICTNHGWPSKHSVDADSHAPCLAIDPY